MPSRLLLGLIGSLLLGALAYRHGALTAGGWLGAVLIGTTTLGFGGVAWGGLVIVFFVLSSALSRFRAGLKQRVSGDTFAKSSRRDLRQALANGGLAALLALLHGLSPAALLFAGGLGALAAATADTWATELGVLSGSAPRLLTTGRSVEPGTSGAISVLGTLAALLGGLTLGLAALLLTTAGLGNGVAAGPWMLPAGLLAGLAGTLVDSLLGATLQGMRRCPGCGRETERLQHCAGLPTVPLRGWQWLDNDLVNLCCTLVGAASAMAVAYLAGA